MALLPLAFLTPFVLGIFHVKLASRLLRTATISWWRSISFGVLFYVVSAARTWADDAGLLPFAPLHLLLAGMALMVAVGACMVHRNVATDRPAVGWRTSLSLASIATVFAFGGAIGTEIALTYFMGFLA